MFTRLFWIDLPERGKLAIMPRPRGGEWLSDEIVHFKECGVHIIVSLLTFFEREELELNTEHDLCKTHQMTWLSMPIPDRSTPERMKEVKAMVIRLKAALEEGKNVAIHCRQGIGRSGLLAASIMVSPGLSSPGILPDDAFQRIIKARGRNVPDTKAQREWVNAFAEMMRTFPEQ